MMIYLGYRLFYDVYDEYVKLWELWEPRFL